MENKGEGTDKWPKYDMPPGVPENQAWGESCPPVMNSVQNPYSMLTPPCAND